MPTVIADNLICADKCVGAYDSANEEGENAENFAALHSFELKSLILDDTGGECLEAYCALLTWKQNRALLDAEIDLLALRASSWKGLFQP